MSLSVFICSVLLLSFVLGICLSTHFLFACLFDFFFFYLFPFLVCAMWLVESCCSSQVLILNL